MMAAAKRVPGVMLSVLCMLVEQEVEKSTTVERSFSNRSRCDR